MRCGRPVSANEEYCEECREEKHFFLSGRFSFSYEQAAQGLYKFKYMNRTKYARAYAGVLCKELDTWIKAVGADALVPVPLHKKRLIKRGYNQALILAREISDYTGIPVRADVLKRVAETPPLKKMSFSERQNNLKKAFQAFGNDVELKTIMLIDDIYTTGATIDACSDALYRQGARSVCFMALATGVDPV